MPGSVKRYCLIEHQTITEVYATYKLSIMHCLAKLWPWFNEFFGAKAVRS